MPSAAKLAKETLRYARINATTEGGENTIVAAVEGRKIIPVGYVFTPTAEGTVEFKTSSATHASFNCAKQGGVSYAGGPESPAFECAEGKALVLVTPAATKVFGHLTYVLT